MSDLTIEELLDHHDQWMNEAVARGKAQRERRHRYQLGALCAAVGIAAMVLVGSTHDSAPAHHAAPKAQIGTAACVVRNSLGVIEGCDD